MCSYDENGKPPDPGDRSKKKFWEAFLDLVRDEDASKKVSRSLWSLGLPLIAGLALVVAIGVIAVCAVIFAAAKALHGIPLAAAIPVGLAGTITTAFTSTVASRKIVKKIQRQVGDRSDG